MKGFRGFVDRNLLVDNYTPVPNMFFDEVMSEVKSMSELKVLLVIFRFTYGMNTEVTEKGERTYKEVYYATMQQIAAKTNLSITSVQTAINGLTESGLIERVVKSKKCVGYKLKTQKADVE